MLRGSPLEVERPCRAQCEHPAPLPEQSWSERAEMGLTRVAITRPVFILMVISALVVLGAVAFTRLNAELFPNINVPIVTIVTTYSGASPDDVDRLVSQPIQDAVAG